MKISEKKKVEQQKKEINFLNKLKNGKTKQKKIIIISPCEQKTLIQKKKKERKKNKNLCYIITSISFVFNI